MKDYQILIDHAWSMDPDLFEMFREHFQIHLNKRRSSVEFQGKLTEAGRRRYVTAVAGIRHLQLRCPLNSPQCKMPARDILPRKIARDKLPLHPSKTWQTPIESIHPPQYYIAGLSFDPQAQGGAQASLDGMIFNMDDIREVCAEFGWEFPDPFNEAFNQPRPYVRALMELEG